VVRKRHPALALGRVHQRVRFDAQRRLQEVGVRADAGELRGDRLRHRLLADPRLAARLAVHLPQVAQRLAVGGGVAVERLALTTASASARRQASSIPSGKRSIGWSSESSTKPWYSTELRSRSGWRRCAPS
jgi:hypothetical protein